MADKALEKLAGHIKAKAGAEAFELNKAFLVAGLSGADSDVAPPDDFDKTIAKAYQTGGGGLAVEVTDKNQVKPVKDDAFDVVDATIEFFGKRLPHKTKLHFALDGDGKTLIVVVDFAPGDWSWTDSFPDMTGWPFSQLDVQQVGFIYSDTAYAYKRNGTTLKLPGGAVQTFHAELPAIPDPAKPVIETIFGLDADKTRLTFNGHMDFAKVDGKKVLLPATKVDAGLETGELNILGLLDVSDPALQLRINEGEPEDDGDGGGKDKDKEKGAGKNVAGAEPAAGGNGEGKGKDADADKDKDEGLPVPALQLPVLGVSAKIKLNSAGKEIEYELLVVVKPARQGLAQTTYTLTLASGSPDLLTPAATLALVGNQGSFLQYVPPVLQEFVTNVGLRQFAVSGKLSKTRPVDQIGVIIGSAPGTSWQPLGQLGGGLDFTINEFTVNWLLKWKDSGRGGAAKADGKDGDQSGDKKGGFKQQVSFSTAFELLPDVFTDGEDGPGVFRVEFDSDLTFSARYEGQAKIEDLLRAVTGGAIGLPSGVAGTLSDFSLDLDKPNRTYSFSGGLEVTLDFLTIQGEPIFQLTDGQFAIGATVPDTDSKSEGGGTLTAAETQAKTQYTGSFSGLIAVTDDLKAQVSIDYDGTADPAMWTLKGHLAEPLDLPALVKKFFNLGQDYAFPDFMTVDVVIETLDATAKIPRAGKKAGGTEAEDKETGSSYEVAATFKWALTLGAQKISQDADVKLAYDGSQKQGQRFSGDIVTHWRYEPVQLDLDIGYTFGPPEESDTSAKTNQSVYVDWEGFRATYTSGKNAVVFTLQGWTLGTLIQKLVQTLGNPYFTLPAPWDLLNQISLDGLSVTVSLDSGKSASDRISAAYTLSSPLNLGFLRIDKLVFKRTAPADGATGEAAASKSRVTIAIGGELFIPGADQSPELRKLVSKDPESDDTGSDAEDMPDVPGMGETSYFKVYLLALGQRVAIGGYQDFESTKDAICALQGIPATKDKKNPVLPNTGGGQALAKPEKGQPYYEASNNWLIATHMTLLKAGNEWTVDLMVVFDDPDLYGLRLALAGTKAKALGGLVIDIMYKKVTDDVGVYQIDFQFPKALRNLNFGAVTVQLPEIGVKIYTNGDFFIDIGFPYELDFTRSFAITVIVYGVPVLGGGGIYFGKLSPATSTQVPVTNKGTFDPVITFGLGLQLGLGYSFQKGPLSARFSLTVFGIVEGTIASFRPYSGDSGSGDLVSSDYYYRVQGTAGIIGLISGKVDFAIIQASLTVNITLAVQITVECYRAIPIVATASVSVSLKVKVDLGLFSFSISLSFSARVTAEFQIGHDHVQDAPWAVDADPRQVQLVQRRAMLRATRLRPAHMPGHRAAVMFAKPLTGVRPKTLTFADPADKPVLQAVLSPQFTVLAPDGGTDPSKQAGAFVVLLSMDAPEATRQGPSAAACATCDAEAADDDTSSFESLCRLFFPWLIDALKDPAGDSVALADALDRTVTIEDLKDFVEALSKNDQSCLTPASLMTFLSSAVTVDITAPDASNQASIKKRLSKGATLLPMFDGLTLSVPDANDPSKTSTVDLESYATADGAYQAKVTGLFDELLALAGAHDADDSGEEDLCNGGGSSADDAHPAAERPPESLASLILVDAFAAIGRQLLQAAEEALKDFTYTMAKQDDPNNSLAGLLAWAHNPGKDKPGAGDRPAAPGGAANPHVHLIDVAKPNKKVPLVAGTQLPLPRLTYTVQAGTDGAGGTSETLAQIAAKFPGVSVTQLICGETGADGDAGQTAPDEDCQDNAKAAILRTDVPVTVHIGGNAVTKRTQPGESFATLARRFGMTVARLVQQDSVQQDDGLLAPGETLRVRGAVFTTGQGNEPDTLESVAARFAVTLPALAASVKAVKPLFQVPEDKGRALTIAHLDTLTVRQLWTALRATNEVAHTAGLVARTLLFGLRLPNQAGLSLSDGFLYPRDQGDFAVYQLTGQQVPTAARAPEGGYPITVKRKDSAHGQDLSFVRFNGDAKATEATVDVTDAFKRLQMVLDYAKTGRFKPSPSFTALSLTERQPKSFAIRSLSRWSSSNIDGVLRVTGATAGAKGQAAPLLLSLPPALVARLEARQDGIAGLTDATSGKPAPVAQRKVFWPAYQPRVQTTDPATQATRARRVENYAWATRVDLEIKRLAGAGTPGGGGGTQGQGNNAGQQSVYTYELVGVSAEDGLLLDRVLSAADGLGSGMLSGVFILYAKGAKGGQDTNSNQVGGDGTAKATSTRNLLSRGPEEFLAFLTQTNLSTESNPDSRFMALANVAAPARPTGVANPRLEFVRLLWQQSVVRSGGYHLFYQDLVSGTGLPADIFDSSDSATLTIVVTYARGDAGFGDHLPGFVNAVVTADAIDPQNDTVAVTSQPGGGPSIPLQKDLTLRQVAAAYGVGPATIAEANPDMQLAGGTLRVSGVIRQIGPGDMADPGDALTAIAQHYSAGAASPVTAEQIKAFNPGVEVALGAVFYLPAISYTITAGAAPGNTFAKIAAYYGVGLDAVALWAADAAGLFADGAQPTVRTRTYQLDSRIAPGNLGIELTRENPGPPELPENPAQADKDAYASAYLYSLYSVAAAGLAKNPFFPATSALLPFGPQQHDDPDPSHLDEDIEARTGHRRARLAEVAADAPLTYRQALGVRGKVVGSTLPADLPFNLKAADNPYAGVGATAEIALRWTDVFGNHTVTPFVAPGQDYTGAISGAAARLRYADRLIGPSAWPSTRLNYAYAGGSGGPSLNISFQFDTGAYRIEPGDSDDQKKAKREAARHAIATYRRVYFQLHQDYGRDGGLKVPGVSGNAVSFRLTNRLLAPAHATTELAGADADQIRDYVGACVAFLYKVVCDKDPGDDPAAQISQTVATGDVADGTFLELAVELTFLRQAELTEPSVAGLRDGLSVTAAVLPQPDAAGQNASYRNFARALEAAFDTPDWALKVGAGMRSAAAGGPQERAQQLWAIRMGKSAGHGVYFEIGDKPAFFAPQPIARKLASGTVEITDYATGQQSRLNFNGVDQNQWFQAYLDAIDGLLAPVLTSRLFLLDRLNGTDDPYKDGMLADLLKTKRSLAGAIAKTLRPVLAADQNQPQAAAAAGEKLYKQLLNRLGSAYAAGAVVVFPLDKVHGAGKTDAVGPPRLYGQPHGARPASARGGETFSLSPAKMPLGPERSALPSLTGVGPVGDAATGIAPSLPFVFGTKAQATDPQGRAGDAAYVPLDLSYKISHVEFDRRHVPGIQGYEESRWLSLVTGPIERKLAEGVEIPVVLRALPSPPTVKSQAAPAHSSAPKTPGEFAKWDYSFGFQYDRAAQDSIGVTIELNLQNPKAARTDEADADPLFTALASFTTNLPAIRGELEANLARLDGKSAPQDAVDKATAAMRAFKQGANEVFVAYRNKFLPSARVSTLQGLKLRHVSVTFDSVLQRDSEGRAVTTLVGLKLNDAPATFDPASVTVTNGKTGDEAITIPAPVVEIDSEAYVPELADGATQPAYVYRRRNSEQPVYLSYADAQADSQRTVAIRGLDVFAYQNGWAKLRVERNKYLLPPERNQPTAETFVFETPPVRFANPVVPRLAYHTPYDAGAHLAPSDKTLAGYLNGFFKDLMQDGGGQPIGLTMTVSYSYDPNPEISGLPRVSLPVVMLPPTAAAAKDAGPAAVGDVAAAVEDWRRDNRPVADQAAAVDVGFTIFSASATDQEGRALSEDADDELRQPLLQLDTLRVGADKVPLKKGGPKKKGG